MIVLDARSDIASASPAGAPILVGRFASGYPFATALYVPGTATGPLAIQDSGGNWYNVSLDNGCNVLWFGAKRDGTTADQAAINAAVTAMSAVGGGKVSIPAGTYALTAGVGLASNIWLCGDGLGTVLKHNNATAFNVVSGANLAKTTVSDLLVDGNNGQSNNGIFFESSEDCIAQRCYTRNVGRPVGGYHYWAENCSNVTFVDCIADGVVDVGFEFYGTTDSTIVNCIARNVTGAGIAFNVYAGSQRCAVIGCTADLEIDDLAGSGTTGISFYTKFGGTSFDLTAANCQISGGRWGVVVAGDTTVPNDETASLLCSRISVLGCNITGYGYYGVAAFNGVEGLTISENSFVAASNCVGGTISLQQAPSTVRRVLVSGNRSIGGPFFVYAKSIAELSVARNLIRDVVGSGIGYGVALVGCVGAQVDGNLMTDLGTPAHQANAIATYLDGTGEGGYCMLTNNTIIDTRVGAARGIAYGVISNPSTNLAANNIVRNTISGMLMAESATEAIQFSPINKLYPWRADFATVASSEKAKQAAKTKTASAVKTRSASRKTKIASKKAKKSSRRTT